MLWLDVDIQCQGGGNDLCRWCRYIYSTTLSTLLRMTSLISSSVITFITSVIVNIVKTE